MGLGPRTSYVVQSGQKGAYLTYNTNTLRPSSTHQNVGRCLIVWIRVSAAAAVKTQLKVSCLFVMSNEWDRGAVCSNRKGSDSSHLGQWQIPQLYSYRQQFEIKTDYKPLVPLLISKHLNNLPHRILQFKLGVAKFHYNIKHVPGKFFPQQVPCPEHPSTGLMMQNWRNR